MFTFKKEDYQVPVKAWLKEEKDIELACLDQINNLAKLPFIYHHLSIMPDTHAGYGMPIGGVLATEGVVIPNAVGVDIGCGMCAVKINLKTEQLNKEMLQIIIEEIKKVIPLGMNHHKEKQNELHMPKYKDSVGSVWIGRDLEFHRDLRVVGREYESALYQLGTLGGGNHFIEIQKDVEDNIWIMIHSGSRNLGSKVADYYNKLAIELNKQWYSSVPKQYKLAFLPLETKEARNYINEMNYCVEFALANRKLMMYNILNILLDMNLIAMGEQHSLSKQIINIAHNYAQLEHHFGRNVMVHRKGATLARKETIGIIPGSQGTKSYIVEGLGNPESFNSCSHGAGRLMSRTKAQENLNLEEEIKKMDENGIIHAIRNKKDLDEAPSAYKNIDTVMGNQSDLVKILVELIPIAVIKGN